MCSMKSLDKFDSLIDLVAYFKTEQICLQYLEQWLWDGNIRCPHCGFDRPYRYKNGVRFKCRSCKVGFTAKIGTIFEKSPIPLLKWFSAMYLMATNSKGISSPNLGKMIGVKRQPTVWFMMHRIREAMKQENVILEGIVSSDEAFVGGKNKNRHKDKRVAYKKGRDQKDKVPVIGIKQKDGPLKTQVMLNTENSSIRPIVLNTVKKGSILVTDEYKAYRTMHRHYQHETVNHKRGNYCTPTGFSTNNVENVWSQLKRTLIGIFHKVSQRYLQRYCDELTFRFNTRTMADNDRFAFLMSRVNSRLTYKKLKRYDPFQNI